MKRSLALLVCLGLSAISQALPSKEGMLPGYWSSGVKQFFGTSYEDYDSSLFFSSLSSTAPISKVWFTGAQGVVTEVFWPTVDVAQVRDSQFLVTDGRGFFFEERSNAETTSQWIENGVPAFKVKNRDPQGRFEIEKTIFTDPDRDVLIQRITIKRNVTGLRFFILHNPAVSNTPLGDNALASLKEAPGQGLYAWQNDHAQALVASLPFKKVTAGYEGTPSDGFQDIKADSSLDSDYPSAPNGNVVLTAQIDIPESRGTIAFEIAIGFGNTIQNAHRSAWESLNQGTKLLLAKYIAQWKSYLSTVRDLSGSSGDGGKLYRASIATMKSMEDKTRPGAFVASPSVPWGLHQTDWNDGFFNSAPRKTFVSGYHIVWPRDLYQMATSFMAVDDLKSAVASLNYLRNIQLTGADGNWTYGKHTRSKDGSFPQNCWVDGTQHWNGLQLDEVGMPVVLAYRLWSAHAIRAADYWEMVRRAADFIADFGPWTPQERWEEIFGASPSTLAAELAALRTAALFAQHMEDDARAKRYQSLYEQWSRNLESWIFTTSGKHGDGKYYVRIKGASHYDANWDANDEATFKMANGSGTFREKDITDGGFLELVRFGVRKALSYQMLTSLPEYDQTIRVDIPGIGLGFRRYLNDRYNYDEKTNQQTLGMPWPLLTGERAQYELAKGVESGLSPFELDGILSPYILTMEKMATPQHYIPEQVWDTGRHAGQPTGAATPLGWAHGEYVKLLRSRLDRKVFDLGDW